MCGAILSPGRCGEKSEEERIVVDHIAGEDVENEVKHTVGVKVKVADESLNVVHDTCCTGIAVGG